MDNSVYPNLANQILLDNELSIIANNSANSGAAGFKQDLQIVSNYAPNNQSKVDIPNNSATIINLQQGSFDKTDSPLDLAINGNAFFAIQTAQGIRYTRNGSFKIRSDGLLADQNNNPVLSEGEDVIELSQAQDNIFVNSKGTIYLKDKEINKLSLVTFENLKFLKKSGNSYFRSVSEPIEPKNIQVLQGYLESSNVNAVSENIKLLNLQKYFSASSSFISDNYSLEKNAYRSIVTNK